jgi:putative copper export protein
VNHDDLPLPIDLYAAARLLAYLAALTLIGACTFAALVPRWRRGADDDQSLAARTLAGAWRVASITAPILLLAHVLRAFGQVRSFLDPEPITWESARPILFSTAWGKGWMAQVAAALLTIPAVWIARRRPATGLGVLGTAALAVAATEPLTGHALEHPWGATLGVGLHTLHLLGGGIWLGTLFTMFQAGLRVARDGDATDVAEMVGAFSPVALTGAALAVTAGSLLGIAYIGNFDGLVRSTYGRALLIKVTLLLTTLGLGAWNWTNVKPRLGEPSVTRELRRSTRIELAIGLVLVAVTAVLVALPAPKL